VVRRYSCIAVQIRNSEILNSRVPRRAFRSSAAELLERRFVDMTHACAFCAFGGSTWNSLGEYEVYPTAVCRLHAVLIYAHVQ
jgi:hypothetical protein